MAAIDGQTRPAPSAGTRVRILRTASALFQQHGFRAVGVDTIVERSGVAKMTLYRHFPSKDDLIAAHAEQSAAAFWAWFTAVTEAVDNPRERLLALFRAIESDSHVRAGPGCTFQRIAAEFPEPVHPAHQRAVEHKAGLVARLRELAAGAGARDPAVLAEQLVLIMDGAWAAARMFGPTGGPARSALRAATAVITAEIGDPRDAHD
jgi:AcrR family transcriptional regulator